MVLPQPEGPTMEVKVPGENFPEQGLRIVLIISLLFVHPQHIVFPSSDTSIVASTSMLRKIISIGTTESKFTASFYIYSFISGRRTISILSNFQSEIAIILHADMRLSELTRRNRVKKSFYIYISFLSFGDKARKLISRSI